MATHSSLENSTDRGAWQATVHGVIGLDTTENACKKMQENGYLRRPTLIYFHWFSELFLVTKGMILSCLGIKMSDILSMLCDGFLIN